MLEALDRHSRDSTLFQFTTKRLKDFIDPKHLLIQIDERFDFKKLVEPLEDHYCHDNGRPAIHPEVLVRALLISSLYNITSFRRLCSAISENVAFRWFCFLTIDDKVFDHQLLHRARRQRRVREDIRLLQRRIAATGATVAAGIRRLEPGKGERQWTLSISQRNERR